MFVTFRRAPAAEWLPKLQCRLFYDYSYTLTTTRRRFLDEAVRVKRFHVWKTSSRHHPQQHLSLSLSLSLSVSPGSRINQLHSSCCPTFRSFRVCATMAGLRLRSVRYRYDKCELQRYRNDIASAVSSHLCSTAKRETSKILYR